MSIIHNAIEFARKNKDKHLEQLKELLSIPSISTLQEHKADVLANAQWLAKELSRLGMMPVEIIPTGGHPMVYGECLKAPGKPTVLVYGHYDVQPVDPLNEWISPPFEPAIRGDYIYARGVSDMKAQIFAQFKAVEAIINQGPLPLNIKYLLEGEEEIGSPNMESFLESRKELLQCDIALNCDAMIYAPDVPSITYALRGLAYYEIEVKGPASDLHSGLFGGTIQNPLNALCSLIAGMHDAKGRVTLPGFYDKVRDLTEEERTLLQKLPLTDAAWKEMSGAPALWGEAGYSTIERMGARPTLDVNGIIGGFTGEGAKTVLPAKASAKLSMRLVADQDPKAICGQLRAYMQKHAPATITWNVRELASDPSAVMDIHSPAIQSATQALEEVFGKKPVFKRDGGSVPIVGMMKQILGVDTVMLGFGLPSDSMHGPNERQYLPIFFKGIETYIRFMVHFGESR